MKKWRLLIMLSILFLLFPLSQIFMPTSASGNADMAGLIQIENSTLLVGFDAQTGNARVKDKRTGQVWTQHYLIPPENENIYVSDFSLSLENNEYINLSQGSLRLVDGQMTAVYELDKTQGLGGLSIVYPLPSFDVGNYRIVVDYKAENISNCSLTGNISFFNFGWDGLISHTLSFFDYNNTAAPDGWQQAEAAIDRSMVPQRTDTFNLSLRLTAPASETGTVYIKSIRVVGADNSAPFVTISNAREESGKILYDVNSFDRVADGKKALTATLSFDPDDEGGIVYDIGGLEADEEYTSFLRYPGTFHSEQDDLNWMLPKDSGVLLPSFDIKNETNKKLKNTMIGEFYSHMGYNMAFVGAVNLSAGDGYLMLIDTPVCAKVRYTLSSINGRTGYMPQVFWFHDKELWKENRRVRFRFYDSGGVVSIAKKYRDIAVEKGFHVTYEEKAKTNPETVINSKSHRMDLALRLSEVVPFYEAMEKAGVKNLMVKLSGVRLESGDYAYIEGVKEAGILDEVVERFPQYQLYEYECYRDVWIEPQDFYYKKSFADALLNFRIKRRNGSYLRGWTDPFGVQSYVVCPTCTDVFLEHQNTVYTYEEYPYVYKQNDTLATVSLSEGVCYDENHPCDRYMTYNYRIKVLKDMKEKYNQGTHIEGGAEYLVPYCEGFEGPLDIMANGGTGELNSLNVDVSDRIPLWQLVFHDCAGTYYHWENGILNLDNIKMQDLVCALYGERGMFLPRYYEYIFENGLLEQLGERINRIDTVLQKVSTDEMIDFEFISEDRKIQRTTFSSGVEVIANFSDTEYEYEGQAITPMGFIISGGLHFNLSPAVLFAAGAAVVAAVMITSALLFTSKGKNKNKAK